MGMAIEPEDWTSDDAWRSVYNFLKVSSGFCCFIDRISSGVRVLLDVPAPIRLLAAVERVSPPVVVVLPSQAAVEGPWIWCAPGFWLSLVDVPWNSTVFWGLKRVVVLDGLVLTLMLLVASARGESSLFPYKKELGSMSKDNSQGYETRMFKHLGSYVLWGSWSSFFLTNGCNDFSKIVRDRNLCIQRNNSWRRFLGRNFLFLFCRSGRGRWWGLRGRENMRMGASIRILTFDRRHFFKNLSHKKRKRITKLKHHETLRHEIPAFSELWMLFVF